MTEAEWLACADPTPMLEFLRGKASDRKLRLFAVACLRRQVIHVLTYPETREIPQLAERWADGVATDAELESHLKSPVVRIMPVRSPRFDGELWVPSYDQALSPDAYHAAFLSAASMQSAVAERSRATYRLAVIAEKLAQVALLRESIGNPFRPVTADPLWLTSTVRTLAEGIYQVRAFDRLPILADALEEAGCDNADILSHCRGPGPHVRGCWVVDLVLGKT